MKPEIIIGRFQSGAFDGKVWVCVFCEGFSLGNHFPTLEEAERMAPVIEAEARQILARRLLGGSCDCGLA